MTTERVAAIARLVATLIASVATAVGLSCDGDAVFTAVAGVLALALFVCSWWKNNNLTDAAAEAQDFLDALKTGSIDEADDVEESEE